MRITRFAIIVAALAWGCGGSSTPGVQVTDSGDGSQGVADASDANLPTADTSTDREVLAEVDVPEPDVVDVPKDIADMPSADLEVHLDVVEGPISDVLDDSIIEVAQDLLPEPGPDAFSPCAGPNPQGCTPGGCPDGMKCAQVIGICLSSACTCDAESGTWACTPDCSGGVCVSECEGTTSGPCVDPGLSCLGCPVGGLTNLENHICTTPCKADTDCTDPARPKCNQLGPGQTGLCTPQAFMCCWFCL